MTEALAEHWHRRIREEWGFADEDGPTIAGLFRQQYRGSRATRGATPRCPRSRRPDQARGGCSRWIASVSRSPRSSTSSRRQSTSAIIVSRIPEAKVLRCLIHDRRGFRPCATSRGRDRQFAIALLILVLVPFVRRASQRAFHDGLGCRSGDEANIATRAPSTCFRPATRR